MRRFLFLWQPLSSLDGPFLPCTSPSRLWRTTHSHWWNLSSRVPSCRWGIEGRARIPWHNSSHDWMSSWSRIWTNLAASWTQNLLQLSYESQCTSLSSRFISCNATISRIRTNAKTDNASSIAMTSSQGLYPTATRVAPALRERREGCCPLSEDEGWPMSCWRMTSYLTHRRQWCLWWCWWGNPPCWWWAKS